MTAQRDEKGRFVKGSTCWNKGKAMSFETRKKLSDSKKGNIGFWSGKKFSKQHRQNISDAKKGISFNNSGQYKKNQIPWMTGRHHSKQSTQKMSESSRKYTLEENKQRKLEYSKKYFDKIASFIGITGKECAVRISKWAITIKNRDNHICQICGDPATVAHHIIYKSVEPRLSLVENNGISLCKHCHAETHGWKLQKTSFTSKS